MNLDPSHSFDNFQAIVGFDWGKRTHSVDITDLFGKPIDHFTFNHTLEGWRLWQDKTSAFSSLAVSIEASTGHVIDQLIHCDNVTVFPINPVSANAFRKTMSPSGNKTDNLDAKGIGSILRFKAADCKPLIPGDPLEEELRHLCRDECALIEERTALINQLQQSLFDYYPSATEAFTDWSQPYTWRFLKRFPTPEALTKAGRRNWEKFLHTNKLYRPSTCKKRLEIFESARLWTISEPITLTQSRLALARVQQLFTLQSQLDAYRARIEELFAQHPLGPIFASLPGAGPKLAPRLLAELTVLSHLPIDVVQCFAGTAPINFQSGQMHIVRMRRACTKSLRHTLHLFADLSRKTCPWAQQYYLSHKAKKKSHAKIMRCLGQRWLRIIWRMLQTQEPYDATLHESNQRKHGSWIVAQLDEKAQQEKAEAATACQ